MHELPDGWTLHRLLDLVMLPMGQVDPRRHPYSAQPLIAPDHIESRTGRLLEVRTAAEQGAISGKYAIAPSDVIYSKIRPALRKATLAKFDGMCSADMYPLRPTGAIDSGYLLAVVLSEAFSTFAEAVSGRSGIPKVNRSELREYVLPLPPVGEQRRIAEVLDALDTLIQRTEAIRAKQQSVQAGTIARLMTQGPTDGQSNWQRFTCRDAFKLASGIPYPSAMATSGPVPIYGASGLSGYSHRALTAGPTFSIGRVGEGGVGVVYYIPGPAWITDNALWAKWIDPRWDAEFVSSYLSWLNLRRLRSQTGQPLVTQAVIAPLALPMPPMKDQLKIVAIVRKMNASMQQIAMEKQKLLAVKQGLMEDLLTGRVRVDMADAVLEVL
ncbi:restriction endonuclease subunit S [Nonomuraea muscovyensis]|uniref:restriction endonuclease subunit S n=1 Tax=Nonomuraea muscovyensis TaxID=1124761 RepID=UPI0033FB823F